MRILILVLNSLPPETRQSIFKTRINWKSYLQFIQTFLKIWFATLILIKPVMLQKAILSMEEMKGRTDQKAKYEAGIHWLILKVSFLSGNNNVLASCSIEKELIFSVNIAIYGKDKLEARYNCIFNKHTYFYKYLNNLSLKEAYQKIPRPLWPLTINIPGYHKYVLPVRKKQ